MASVLHCRFGLFYREQNARAFRRRENSHAHNPVKHKVEDTKNSFNPSTSVRLIMTYSANQITEIRHAQVEFQ
jgi:hypothetical protein